MRESGYEVCQLVDGDGNCLWHTVALKVNEDESRHGLKLSSWRDVKKRVLAKLDSDLHSPVEKVVRAVQRRLRDAYDATPELAKRGTLNSDGPIDYNAITEHLGKDGVFGTDVCIKAIDESATARGAERNGVAIDFEPGKDEVEPDEEGVLGDGDGG